MKNIIEKIALLMAVVLMSLFVKADEDLIVTINGREIRRSDAARNVEMMVLLNRNKNQKLSDNQVGDFRKRLAKGMPEILAVRALLETKLMATNILCPEKIKTRIERRYLENFGAPKQEFKGLLDLVGRAGFQNEFSRNFEFDMRMESLLETVYSNEVHASENDLKQARMKDEAYNATAMATNAFMLVTASNLVARARAGEDFTTLADKYSQDNEENPHGSLGDCDENDFADEPGLWKQIKRTPVGGVTDVIETSDGYCIYKVIAHHTAEESSSETDALQLSRIYLPRAYVIEEKPEDEFREEVEDIKRERFVNGLISRLRKESTVVKANKGK